MVAAYIDPALGVLRSQLKSRYPGVTIYWIGDPAHRARLSDHNPEADGSVDAIDIMVTSQFTKSQTASLIEVLTRTKDWRISYIIWDGRIWNSADGWKKYYGKNQHRDHAHISRNDKQERNTDPWVISGRVFRMLEVTGQVTEVKEGDNDSDYPGNNIIVRIQKQVGVKADGDWGPLTTAGIKRSADVTVATPLTAALYKKIFGLK